MCIKTLAFKSIITGLVIHANFLSIKGTGYATKYHLISKYNVKYNIPKSRCIPCHCTKDDPYYCFDVFFRSRQPNIENDPTDNTGFKFKSYKPVYNCIVPDVHDIEKFIK